MSQCEMPGPDPSRLELAMEEWRRQRRKEIGPHAPITVAEEAEARWRILETLAAEERIASGGAQTNAPGFFERNCVERPEIIEGILRESQLAAFAGPFGMGKSPVLADLVVRLIHGLSWCGRKVAQRPVIHIDCETAGPDYKRAITAIASRLGVRAPSVPAELDVYLERDDAREASTEVLLKAVSEHGHKSKLRLIETALSWKPNAVVFIDPLEMFFRLDTTKKADVLGLYRELRNLLARFPKAAMMLTFNLRKRDRKNAKANLLSDPRDWLEEVCGSLDLLNRSDVRLGIDCQEEEVRVINGIVRGREMHPLLIRSVTGSNDELAGFEQVTPDDLDLLVALTEKQRGHWDKLPSQFRFEEVAEKIIPRTSLFRIIKRATSIGALTKGDDGAFRKVLGPPAETRGPVR
jgi:hypothetical protein